MILLTALSPSAAMRSLELIAYREPGCSGGEGGEDGGEGGGFDGSGAGGEGGSEGGMAPPPQAQHMVLEVKSVSS